MKSEDDTRACYLLINETTKEVWRSDSANKVGTFVWGKSSGDWTIYKAVRDIPGDIKSLRNRLEER